MNQSQASSAPRQISSAYRPIIVTAAMGKDILTQLRPHHQAEKEDRKVLGILGQLTVSHSSS